MGKCLSPWLTGLLELEDVRRLHICCGSVVLMVLKTCTLKLSGRARGSTEASRPSLQGHCACTSLHVDQHCIASGFCRYGRFQFDLGLQQADLWLCGRFHFLLSLFCVTVVWRLVEEGRRATAMHEDAHEGYGL